MSHLLQIGTGLTSIALLASTSPLVAQPKSIDVRASIECFEGSLLAGLARSECPPDVVPVQEVVLYSDRFDSSEVAALADALKDLAANADSVAVQTTAMAQLAYSGWRRVDSPVPGTVARLTELYTETGRPSMRESIISQMHMQSEREAAEEFLVAIATSHQANETRHLSNQYTALQTLGRMGPDKASVLRHLYAEGTVVDPQAKLYLERLAESDFQLDTP